MHFADLPTAVDEAPRLAEALGIRRLLIKRDDNTGLAMGGNKARKLEYSIAEARDAGADVILTCGGPQSNHVRMTAAAARKAGMDSILFMPQSEKPDTFGGNLLLDAVLGAEMRFLPNLLYSEINAEMARAATELTEQGRVPYILPMGGSTPLADLGYVNAMQEISTQLQELDAENADIFVAVGTGGTLAGIAAGSSAYLPTARLFGISVVLKTANMLPIVTEHARKTAALIGINDLDLSRMQIRDQYIGKAYGVPTAGGKEAIMLTARTEGIILDPVYTGKAMAGLIDLARKCEIGRDRPVLFWHTGGAPGLFDYESLFHDEAIRLAK